jgi:hypothetical protein
MSIIDDVQREQDIYELAIDIARQIWPIPQLLLKYKINEHELEELNENPVFKEIVKNTKAEWEAAGNTHKRTKLKAAVLVEATLESLYDSMTNTNGDLGERIKGLDTIAKIAGLNSSDGAGGPVGSTFKLSINFAPEIAAGMETGGVILEMGPTVQEPEESSGSSEDRRGIPDRFSSLPPEDI